MQAWLLPARDIVITTRLSIVLRGGFGEVPGRDVSHFELALVKARYSNNDVVWMPKFWLPFVEFHSLNPENPEFDRDHVVRFSKSLRDVGVPAWQRRQTVRAVDAFQKLIR